MLKAKDIAEMWGIAAPTVYALTKRATDPLPHYRIGGIRFDPAEVEAWKQRQKAA